MKPFFIRSPWRRELISTTLDFLAKKHQVALVTLCNIEGSAPYPLGTQMLVRDDGVFVGQITGGCAEQAIADQALVNLQSKTNGTQRFGLNSPYFDIQLPCGSGIDVLVDVETPIEEYKEIQSSLDARQEITKVLEFDAGSIVRKYLPNQRLVLVGQGPILMHAAKLSLATGFDVCCLAQDDRTLDYLRQHDLRASLMADTPTDESQIDRYTGVVSLFHEHELENDLLSLALKSEAFYIGALGSRRTHAQRCEQLIGQHGHDRQELERIHGPVGININAQSPSQIASAVVSQAIDELNKAIDGISN